MNNLRIKMSKARQSLYEIESSMYEEFKRRLLAEDCGGMEIGDAPKPKYDMNTAEGRMAYYRDNPDIDITF